jgi:hypothetical protein
LDRLPKQAFGHWAAANIAGANEKDGLHSVAFDLVKLSWPTGIVNA